MRILEPPEDIVRRLQKCLVDFFRSGQHWLKASGLYLPLQEGGQGLVDIRSRVKAFRLQTVKKLLYGEDVSWAEVACTLLRRAGNMGLDRHLFLMDINKIDLSGLSFLQVNFNILDSLQSIPRTQWCAENVAERRIDSFNPALNILKSISLRNTLKTAKLLKVGQFLSEEGWISAAVLAEKLGIRSIRFAQNILTQLSKALPLDYRLCLETHDDEEDFFSLPRVDYFCRDWIME